MITEHDLQEAIAECQGQKNPTASTCIKLAAFYTIKRELFGEPMPEYSFAPAPEPEGVSFKSDTEFAQKVQGRKPEDVWAVMDELMETIRQLHPKLYRMVIEKL